MNEKQYDLCKEETEAEFQERNESSRVKKGTIIVALTNTSEGVKTSGLGNV